MKYFLIYILIISNSWASVSKQDVYDVALKLKSNANIGHSITISFVNNPQIQMMNNGYHIRVFTGIMRFLKDKDELALILGHEYGHIMNRDYMKRVITMKEEYTADYLGAMLMAQSGYNKCNAVEVWKRWPKTIPDGVHPEHMSRYYKLKKGC